MLSQRLPFDFLKLCAVGGVSLASLHNEETKIEEGEVTH